MTRILLVSVLALSCLLGNRISGKPQARAAQPRHAFGPTGKPSSRPALVQGQPVKRSGQPALDRERLRRAFEIVESSGRAQVFGDSGQSWGLFQFQRARWAESGGQPSAWGKAGADEQRRVMRRAIGRYAAGMPKGLTVEQQACWIGRAHNGGKRRPTHNAYTWKLWSRYHAG